LEVDHQSLAAAGEEGLKASVLWLSSACYQVVVTKYHLAGLTSVELWLLDLVYVVKPAAGNCIEELAAAVAEAVWEASSAQHDVQAVSVINSC
jgi:hypothetical protein